MSAREESIKLTANFCNTVGGGFIVTGALGPLVTFLYGDLFQHADPALVFVGGLICVFLGGSLHLVGKSLLGALDD